MKVKPSSELTPQERDELAKYLPKGIDVNTMADCFYLVSKNFTAIQEKYGKLEPWRIDAHQVKDFLQRISDFDIKTIKLKQKQIISVDRILSKPCNKWRLAKALAHLEAKQNVLPILVDAYKVEGIGYWYTVTDGVHRTTAAKITGQLEIEATVLREIVLDCAVIRRKYGKLSQEKYLLEVLGIKKSLPGMIVLIWKLFKSLKSELED